MAIVAYTGLPGHGKSYGVVENVIVPALKPTEQLPEGREVWTNIPLKISEIHKQFPNARVTVFDVKDMEDPRWCLDTVPPGVVFVLDEVMRIWPAGVKTANVAPEYRQFLAEHRHMVGDDGVTTEICLIAQDLSQIANFARELIESTTIANKLTAIGANKRFRADVYQGAIKGQSGVKSKLIRSIQGSYKPEVYRLYQSHTMSKTGQAGAELAVDRRNTIWQRPMIKYGVPIGAALFAFMLWHLYNFFNPVPDAEQVQTTKPAVPAAPARKAPNRQLPKPTPFSKDWRLTGVFQGSNGVSWAFISGRNGRSRRIPASACHRFHDTGERYCDVAGAHVASWTGPDPDESTNSFLPSGVPNTAS